MPRPSSYPQTLKSQRLAAAHNLVAKPANDPLAPALLLRVRQDLRAAFEGNTMRPPKKTY